MISLAKNEPTIKRERLLRLLRAYGEIPLSDAQLEDFIDQVKSYNDNCRCPPIQREILSIERR